MHITKAEQYIEQVALGMEQPDSGIAAVIARHLADFTAGPQESGAYFSRDHAIYALRHLRLLKLQPWQQALIWILFGWRTA